MNRHSLPLALVVFVVCAVSAYFIVSATNVDPDLMHWIRKVVDK